MTQNIKFRLEDIIECIVWKYHIYAIIQLMLCDIPRYLYWVNTSLVVKQNYCVSNLIRMRTLRRNFLEFSRPSNLFNVIRHIITKLVRILVRVMKIYRFKHIFK